MTIRRCAWCGMDMGTTEGPEGVSHGICPCCSALVAAQNALLLVIRDFDRGPFSEADRAEVREAYALINEERQKRGELAKNP